MALNKYNLPSLLLLLALGAASCNEPKVPDAPGYPEGTGAEAPRGKLFIIGGGKRPPALVARLCAEAGVDSTQGYALILPYASSEPDSSYWYAKQQFAALGIATACGPLDSSQATRASFLDSLATAPLIYLPGGDQNALMAWLHRAGMVPSIQQAYQQGGTVAGTSAGAAVMSAPMITGNERHYPDYSATFRHLEADNIELAEGLGLLPGVLIDQHFVKRSRYNRLLSAVMEHPEWLGIGIDEATALLVTQGTQAEVVGTSQILLFRAPPEGTATQNGLLGVHGITIDVLLPGEKWRLN